MAILCSKLFAQIQTDGSFPKALNKSVQIKHGQYVLQKKNIFELVPEPLRQGGQRWYVVRRIEAEAAVVMDSPDTPECKCVVNDDPHNDASCGRLAGRT